MKISMETQIDNTKQISLDNIYQTGANAINVGTKDTPVIDLGKKIKPKAILTDALTLNNAGTSEILKIMVSNDNITFNELQSYTIAHSTITTNKIAPTISFRYIKANLTGAGSGFKNLFLSVII